MSNSKFKAHFAAADTVADYNQSHYIEIPKFQDVMVDLLNRDVTILKRIQSLPATGHPTRYWEQTKLPHNAKFVDVRNGEANGKYGVENLDTDYGRVERSAFLKAMTSRITFSMFDSELVRQQKDMDKLFDKDMNDMIVDFLKTQNDAIWNGKATSVMDSTSNEYCGLITQITDSMTVANPFDLNTETGVFLFDVIRTKVAEALADTRMGGRVSALYANPVTIDYLVNSELARKNLRINVSADKIDIGNGHLVPKIYTQAGELPLIPDPYIKVTDAEGKKNHVIVGLNESLVERHYLTSDKPRLFKMGLGADLLDDYVAVLFDTVILKGADSHAHFKINFTTNA